MRSNDTGQVLTRQLITAGTHIYMQHKGRLKLSNEIGIVNVCLEVMMVKRTIISVLLPGILTIGLAACETSISNVPNSAVSAVTDADDNGLMPDANQEQAGQSNPSRIDLASAAVQLGVTEQSLRDALGEPGQGPPDFVAVAAKLDISEQALIAALGAPVDSPSQDRNEGQPPQSQSQTGSVPYPIVDTGQVTCYDDRGAISCPKEDEAFYGQDAQYTSRQPSYQDNGDGTVTDLNTGLMWIQDAGDKAYYYDAIEAARSFEFAGYSDWRVPTIKELYSLMDFSGIDDAVAGTDPFINDVFVFEYGDVSAGDRPIDSQWITSTIYVADVMGGQECFFGVNFADGRIKCYPTRSGGNNGYFLRMVRGQAYGENSFVNNGNDTITDAATGLMWQQADSAAGVDWEGALSYCENLSLAGYDDWRLPDAKELQSIVDYTRSPDTTGSAAIDPLFGVSEIVNEAGQSDYPFFWTSTTHASARGGETAAYIAFGRALGYFHERWDDVHGAGAQRSDPKSGNPADYPTYFGPQGDVSRLLNYVRCVREGASREVVTGGDVVESATRPAMPPGGEQRHAEQAPQGKAQNGDRPQLDLASAAAQLGVTEQALRAALGDPSQGPPDFNSAAAQLGVSVEALMDALDISAGSSPPGGGKP